jgi:two-component system LytT family sensor kinase
MTRSRAWLWYVLAWVPAALLYGMSVGAQPDVLFIHGVISGIVVMGAAALLGVVVIRITGRVPLPGSAGRIRFALTHLLFAAIYSIAWVAVLFSWLRLVAGAAVVEEVWRQAAMWQFLTGAYLYALIAGGTYLLRAQRALRERTLAMTRAQLQAVRAQLQPHFLFNALHAVSSLVRTDPDAAERAIEQLGDLLRRTLHHGDEELVAFAEEWAFAREYLDLEQLRLGARLRVDAHIDDSALDVTVPAFVLQPLVENAVKHGIAPLTAGGTIEIDARRRDGTLTLRVRDNGAGAAPERITRAGGLGLQGVRRQLEEQYAGRAQLHIDTKPGSGFTVTITLPAHE